MSSVYISYIIINPTIVATVMDMIWWQIFFPKNVIR